ncbi:zinc finger MYM-type protein 5-like [Hydra vulgaris]|uniref:zinc finger MYM-type protein 5-like n=1 Tax=Hydra vulgaris TaxID=6087 RepID=UPI001F5F6F54|nr:zinc finger MYM-type protein 5-like [Hydra vulgaris]
MPGKPTRDRDIGRTFINLDAGKWTFPITDCQRHALIQNNLHQNIEKSNESYLKDTNNRNFSKFHFTQKLINSETQHRRLVYSLSKDKVYCFPCRLLSHTQTQMVKEGCCDWKDPSRILHQHEKNQGHIECMVK